MACIGNQGIGVTIPLQRTNITSLYIYIYIYNICFLCPVLLFTAVGYDPRSLGNRS